MILNNKLGQGDEIIIYAAVFIALFLVGGIIGSASLPEFSGRFYISGLLFAIFGTGAGMVVMNIVFRN